jgi:hypothetical protein
VTSFLISLVRTLPTELYFLTYAAIAYEKAGMTAVSLYEPWLGTRSLEIADAADIKAVVNDRHAFVRPTELVCPFRHFCQ